MTSNAKQNISELTEDQEFLYQLTLHGSLMLQARAQGMIGHAKTHRAVSKVIIESVIGGNQYVGLIWDARTQGTHGIESEGLVIQRYESIGKGKPDKTNGLLPGCLTAEELANASNAAVEFSVWLQAHKPVAAIEAVRQFQAIGQKYQSTDHDFLFIWTLDHAKACLAWLEKEGQ